MSIKNLITETKCRAFNKIYEKLILRSYNINDEEETEILDFIETICLSSKEFCEKFYKTSPADNTFETYLEISEDTDAKNYPVRKYREILEDSAIGSVYPVKFEADSPLPKERVEHIYFCKIP